MKHLYYIRHGQSEANVARVFAGNSETPLTAVGKQQAAAAGLLAKQLAIDHIISSPLGRAKETAKIIAREIGYDEDAIELNGLLVEQSYGTAEGLSWETDLNMDGIVDIETEAAVSERANLAFEHIVSLPYETILIVSHGSFGLAFRDIVQPEHAADIKAELENAKIIRLV